MTPQINKNNFSLLFEAFVDEVVTVLNLAIPCAVLQSFWQLTVAREAALPASRNLLPFQIVKSCITSKTTYSAWLLSTELFDLQNRQKLVRLLSRTVNEEITFCPSAVIKNSRAIIQAGRKSELKLRRKNDQIFSRTGYLSRLRAAASRRIQFEFFCLVTISICSVAVHWQCEEINDHRAEDNGEPSAVYGTILVSICWAVSRKKVR